MVFLEPHIFYISGGFALNYWRINDGQKGEILRNFGSTPAPK